jgi:FkbM family methyltransferase
MNFDNPAWRTAPVRTGIKVAKSLARRMVPGLERAVVAYDGGRSSIYADLHTPTGLILYRYGHDDPDIDLVGRLLVPGDVFVDGGANIGLFTLVAADRVGTGGKVIAFEPGRAIRLRLIENVALNRLVQVEVIPFALSSAPGEAAFRVFDIGGAGLNHLALGAAHPAAGGADGTLETVALTTLDAVVIPQDRGRLALIKLDLEGAEHEALRGAESILHDRRPDLLLEIEPSHLQRMGSSANAVAALLRGHGYSFFRVGRDDAGALHLEPAGDMSAPAARPNVFATVDPTRARQRGVSVR